MWSVREACARPAIHLADDLTDECALVLVGTIDGAVIGYLVARVETLRDGAVLGSLSDLYGAGRPRGRRGEELVEQATAQP